MKKVDIMLMLKTIVKKAWIILIFIALFAIIFFGVTHFRSVDLYESEARIYISNSYVLNKGNYYLERSVNITDCIEIVDSEDLIMKVAKEVPIDKDIEAIRKDLKIENAPGTRVISIKYTSPDKKESEEFVENLRIASINRLSHLFEDEEVVTVDNMHSKLISVNDKAKRSALNGGILGILIGVCFILINYRREFTVMESD